MRELIGMLLAPSDFAVQFAIWGFVVAIIVVEVLRGN